jgi:hypothetical protein
MEQTPLEECPAAWSHWIVDAAGVERHALSVVRPTAPDHTGRTNKIAHHLLLHASELTGAGPAWLMMQRGVMDAAWVGEAREIPKERHLPQSHPVAARPCALWEEACGDAGWAGVIANSAVLDPAKPCSIVYPAGVNALALIAEALALVPVESRWRVTFTSYFMQPVAGLKCTWRFCLDGTEAATAARSGAGTLVDLTTRAPCTRTGSLIDAARRGKEAEAPQIDLPRAAPSVSTMTEATAARAATPRAAIAPILTPRVDVGVDLIESAGDRPRQRNLAAFIAFGVAAVLLVTTVVFFALWQREAGLVAQTSTATRTPDAVSVEASTQVNIDAAEARAERERARAQELVVELEQSKTTVAGLEDQVKELEEQRDALRSKLATSQTQAAATESQGAPAVSTGASAGAPIQHAVPPIRTSADDEPDDLGPPASSRWQVVSMPQFQAGIGGDWSGSTRWVPTGVGHPTRAAWVTGDEIPTGRVTPSGSELVEVGSGANRATIARLQVVDGAVQFEWCATAEAVNRLELERVAVERLIRPIPIRVECDGGRSVWMTLERIREVEVSVKPWIVPLRVADEQVFFSAAGGAWTELSATFDVPVALPIKGGGQTATVGVLSTQRTSDGLRVSFVVHEDYDPVVLNKRLTKAEDARARARQAARTATDAQRTLRERDRADADLALNTVEAQRANAESVMKGLVAWRAMFVQRGSLPIEISIRPPAAAKATKTGAGK